jgi:glycosyltransferase involved in cell wall biosynthesis/GT2 family glycosyltransferase
MRIGIVSRRIGCNDGQGRVNRAIAAEALRQGHAVTLYCEAADAEIIRAGAAAVLLPPPAWLPTRLVRDQLFAIRTAWRLRRRRAQLDAVLACGFATWAAADVNAVHFVHRAWRASPHHPWRQRRSVATLYRWLFSGLNAALERQAFRRAGTIVAVSATVQRELVAAGVPAARIATIPNGVDAAEFHPGPARRAAFGLPEGVPLALFAGDLATPRKNLDTVLSALAAVPGLHLAVAGRHAGTPWPALARALGVAGRVHFLGFCTDMPALMRAADLFVMPSRYEPFGLVLLEALASGLPVIAAAGAGGAELITPGTGAVLVDCDDAAALAAALRHLLARPDRAAMAAAARRTALAHSGPAMAQQYLALLQRGAVPTPAATLAVVICTMDRPELLRRCLASLAAGTARPAEILVSDDSRDGGGAAAVCAAFPGVRHLAGPRRGLCANRNAAIRQACAGFVSLLDDDAVVAPDFVARAQAVIAALPPRTLVTGTVIETDRPVVPGNRRFLGFFGRAPRRRFENINLNCNLIPRSAFDGAGFDETIGYGYEDMDLCARLLAQGYVIRHDPGLVATHLPPCRGAALDRQRFVAANRARFYTGIKHYLLWRPNPVLLLAFIVAAPLHRALHAVRTGKWFDLPHVLADMAFALRATLRERARLRRPPLPAPAGAAGERPTPVT